MTSRTGRKVVFYEPGSPDVLRIENRPVEKPVSGEVLLQIEAIGVNRAEIAFRQGRYLEVPQTYPSGLGLEAAGLIVELGPDVEGFACGERVATLPVFSMQKYNVYSDFVILPAEFLVRYPASLTATEAAAVWMSSLTAYGGLLYLAGLKSGDFALITAASSTVGLAAIQIADYMDATVIATTRSTKKSQRLLEAGAKHVIVTGSEDLVNRIQEITSGAGVDACFDAVGGAMLAKLVIAARSGARIVLYGTLSAELTLFPLHAALQKYISVHAYRNRAMVRFSEERRKAERFIYDRLAEGTLRAIIDRVFPIHEVKDAHRYVESNEQFGKIVLSVA